MAEGSRGTLHSCISAANRNRRRGRPSRPVEWGGNAGDFFLFLSRLQLAPAAAAAPHGVDREPPIGHLAGVEVLAELPDVLNALSLVFRRIFAGVQRMPETCSARLQ